MYSCGPLHMDEQRQDGQHEPTYSRSVPIRDVFLKTSRKQWAIGTGGERGSWISVLIVQHDDDDDDDLKNKFAKQFNLLVNLVFGIYLDSKFLTGGEIFSKMLTLIRNSIDYFESFN